jgi:hypothetical protein
MVCCVTNRRSLQSQHHTVTRYTNKCNLMCALKESKVFSVPICGEMLSNISFRSLVQNFNPNPTINEEKQKLLYILTSCCLSLHSCFFYEKYQ